MKLVFALDVKFKTYNGHFYSVGQFTYNWLQQFLEFFDQVEILCRISNSQNEGVSESARSSGPNVCFTILPNIASATSAITERRNAIRIAKKSILESDGVIARLPGEIGMLTCDLAKKLGRPLMGFVCGCPFDGLRNHGTLRGKVYAPIARVRMKKSVKYCDFTRYVTSKFLQRRYPSRNPVMTIGVSDVGITETIVSIEKRFERIEDLKSGAKVRIGLIGSLKGKLKGIHLLIEALGHSEQLAKRIEVRIIGPGSWEPWKIAADKHGVAENFFYDGLLADKREVFEWLDSIDIYVQPSLREGLPRALVEAMSRGCPTIASDLAGIPELLDKEDLIAPGRADILRSRLEKQVSDFEWMKRSAHRNWKTSSFFEEKVLMKKNRVHFEQFVNFCHDSK